MKILQVFITLALFVSLSYSAFSQEVEKSSIIEEIGSSRYYIHLVQADEAIEQIARLYEVDVQEIYQSTPGVFEGQEIKSNHILRIPVKYVLSKESSGSDTITESYERSIQTRQPDERGTNQVKPLRPDIEKSKTSKRFEYHQVEDGETLYRIAKKYSVSIENIRKVNPGLQKDIRTNQTLMIPVYLAENDKAESKVGNNIFKGTKFSFYSVKPKETIYSITKNFGISQDDLIQMNPGLKNSELKAGSKIRIPHESTTDASVNYSSGEDLSEESLTNPDSLKTVRRYKVGFLERLPGIAKREDVALDEIYKLNSGIKEKGVSWGDVIKLPRKALIINQMDEGDDAVDYITHKVSKNETLFSISRLYDIPQEDIIALNPGAGRVIKRGQVLKIPVNAFDKVDKIPEIEIETPEDKETLPKEEMEVICSKREASGKVFKVALMIPFFLEDYKQLDVNSLGDEKPNIHSHNFIQFYEGAMIAIDTLRKQGMSAEVYVYDVGKTQEDAQGKMDEELSDVDLIIGPIYHEAFRTVSEFARQHQIKIVNPLSTKPDILDENERVFKVQAPKQAELNAMASFIGKNYNDTTSIFIVRDNQYQEQEALQFLKRELKENGMGTDDMSKIFEVVYYSDSLNPVLDSTQWGNKNLVIGLSDKEVFTIEFVRHVNEMHDSIPNVTLFGLSDWRKFNLEFTHLENLDVHLFDDEFIDYESRQVHWFVKKYRDWYATEPLPEKYAFEGYDITYYFLSAMFNYGRDFKDCLKFFHPHLLQHQILFIDEDGRGYENKKVIPLRYHRYKLQPVIQNFRQDTNQEQVSF